MAKSIPLRSQDYSLWYNEIIKKAGLAENSNVKGSMIIKPYGYSIWEKIQSELDQMFKNTGHSNAYFPLFIPKSYLSREASHVAGFAKECAIVTHYRLKTDNNGGLCVDPDAKLEEELIVRPTSETTIWNSYRNWIQSYRDLPLLLNQWANVVRWEMRTRLFLRTSEFLWQEGHTAHATRDEAMDETLLILGIYEKFVQEFMSIPVIKGIKTLSERFAGAEDTYCIEAMMQDGKALQAGTSHFLGQNFSKAFDVKYATKEGKNEYVWGTSWGVSTRLMGALIMTHSDDEGLVLPPKLAPIQVVIIPIFKSEDDLNKISTFVHNIKQSLNKEGVSVKYDDRTTHKPGWKFSEYEMKGVPVRMSIGLRDIENQTIEIARRDTKEKISCPAENILETIKKLLDDIQVNLFHKAQSFKNSNTYTANTYDQFREFIEKGFVLAHWDGSEKTEQIIKNETKATIRCIPLDQKKTTGKCIYSGQSSEKMVIFAKSY